MFVEITGNGAAELDRLGAALARTTGGQLARLVAKEGADAISDVQTAQFMTGVSPRGQAHEPLKLRQGVPLFDTGILMESARVMCFGLELRIESALAQSNLQNWGGTVYPVKARALSWVTGGRRYFASKVTIPARPFVPTQGSLPEPWAVALDGAEELVVPPFLPESP